MNPLIIILQTNIFNYLKTIYFFFKFSDSDMIRSSFVLITWDLLGVYDFLEKYIQSNTFNLINRLTYFVCR